jgi:hypothetical protein
LQEGGADSAALLLQRYTARTATWDVAKEGEFWDAVGMAHGLDRQGEGKTIAVIDGSFDVSIPALATHATAEAVAPGAPTAHGTVAALLALEVAPRARLMLHAASKAGKLRSERVIAAIERSVADGADIINLSMGVGLPDEEVLRTAQARSNPAYSEDALEPDDWRTVYDIPATPLWTAARAAVQAGVTVVASAGNFRGYVFTPAAVPGVASVGFHAVQRSVEEGELQEYARSTAPSFSQSERADVLVVQPAHVLGSSFACPLISGFAAVMQDRHELPAYLLCGRRAANASGVERLIEEGVEPPDKTVLWVDSLYKSAFRSAPHPHQERLDGTCPECAFFAAPLFIDFGLFTAKTGNPDIAFDLLSAARRFAPRNAFAAANLGVVSAVLARNAKAVGDIGAAKEHLAQAVQDMSEAVRLRPGYAPYETRLAEFSTAEEDPTTWTMER